MTYKTQSGRIFEIRPQGPIDRGIDVYCYALVVYAADNPDNLEPLGVFEATIGLITGEVWEREKVKLWEGMIELGTLAVKVELEKAYGKSTIGFSHPKLPFQKHKPHSEKFRGSYHDNKAGLQKTLKELNPQYFG